MIKSNIPKMQAIDPVCGLHVDPAYSNLSKIVQGHVYYFCTGKCHKLFARNPSNYIKDTFPSKRNDYAKL